MSSNVNITVYNSKAAQEAAERAELAATKAENIKNFTLKSEIPAPPGLVLPTLDPIGDPVVDGMFMEVNKGNYTNVDSTPLQVLKDKARLYFNQTKWEVALEWNLPILPSNGLVQFGETNAVDGDKTARAITNNGSPLTTEGYAVRSVNDYPIANAAIVNGNGGVTSSPSTSITELTELPEDWLSVEYYHIPSTTYGIGFYTSTGNAISLTLPNTQDAIIEIKKSDYPELKTAKYVRGTRYTNNPLYNFKNRFLIKTKTDFIYKFSKFQKFNDYDAWVLKERNNGNFVVDYDYKSLPSTPSTGLKRSAYIEIKGWNSLIALIPQSAAQRIVFYNSAYVEVGSVTGDTSIALQYRTVDKSEFPTAEYLVVTGLDSSKNLFRLSVSMDAGKKEIKAEGEKNNFLNQNGLIVEYLPYNTRYFTKVGAYYFSSGTVDSALTQFKATDIIELPTDWSYIEYDNFLSSAYGLVLFDENKRFIGFNPNASTSEYKIVRALRENFSMARYYAFAWGDTLKDLYFKIVRDPKTNNRVQNPQSLTFLNTRMANLDITSFEEWNSNPAFVAISKDKAFNSTEIPGKHVIRIPTMALTNNKTEIVVAEARNSGEDKGQFDIYVKRRIDGGSTWTMTNVIPYNSATYGRGMNPSIVVDRTGAHGVVGRIYVFASTVKNDTQYAVFSPTSELDMFYVYSDDDGLTWSGLNSLKSLWNTTDYTASLPSCAAGIQMADGTLVIPTMVVKSSNWRSGVLYKKPGGNWTFSTYSPRALDNECNVLEVNGKLILSARTESQQFKYRPVYEYDFTLNKFIKTDMDVSFNPYINCKASIIKMTHAGSTFFLMSYPDSSKVEAQVTGNTRFNLTVWVSTDCKHWIRSYVVQHPLSMGYSELAFHNGKLSIAYEVGTVNLEVEIQNITPLLDKLKYDTFVNSKLTAEDRMNRIIYLLKSWTY